MARPLTRLKKFRLGRDRRQWLLTGELRSLAKGSFNASQAKRFDKAIFRRMAKRVRRCVPQSPQNSRVTLEIVAGELERRAARVFKTLRRHQHEHVRRAARQ